MPVTPARAVASANPGSSDQRLEPMTRKRGSSVARSMRTRSIAPGAARWPPLIWAPSKAGPGRARRGEQPVAVAEHDLGVRADVDERASTSSARCGVLGEDHAGGVGADVAGDARQDVDARARVGPAAPSSAAGRPDGPVGGERERRRAERHRVDAEQEVMHDRVADDRQLEDRRATSTPARAASPATSSSSASRTARGHLGRALGMHHRVRDPAHQVLAEADLRVHHAVARRGPRRRRGRRGGRRSWSSRRRSRRRSARSWRPGQTPVIVAAVVDGDRHPVARPPRAPAGGPGSTCEVGLEAGRGPTRARAPRGAGRGRRRRGELAAARPRRSGAGRPGRSTKSRTVDALAHDLAVDLALRRDVDEDVAVDVRRCSQAAGRRRGPWRRGTSASIAPGGDRWSGARGDAVLGERADARLDLAAAADAAPAADRVDVDAERARGVEDGRARREPAAPPRRREDDERSSAGGSSRSPGQPAAGGVGRPRRRGGG